MPVGGRNVCLEMHRHIYIQALFMETNTQTNTSKAHTQTYLWYKVQYGVTKEGGGPQGDEEGIGIPVVLLELLALGHGEQGQAKQGCQTHQHHQQEAIAICCMGEGRGQVSQSASH